MPTITTPSKPTGGPVTGTLGNSPRRVAAFDGDASPLEWAGFPFVRDSAGDASQYGGQTINELVNISLFTNRRAEADDQVDDASELFGWYGDSYNETKIGSRLWLLRRRKSDAETVGAAEYYASEALQWLIDYGIARSVNVEAARIYQGGGDTLGLVVTIDQAAEGETLIKFADLWAQMGGE
jgi:phage gp46-like protein